MAKALPNDYRLENGNRSLTPDEIKSSLAHFEYFMGNFQQIVNKERQIVPFRLNAFQQKLFETILPMVRKETRVDKKHNVLVVKGRQVGASVSTVALINYLCAYADLHNLSIAHVFPVGDTITKFYNQKVVPIITGIHGDLFPSIERETLSASILTKYNNLQGIPLDNYYELISSGSSSIRSSTINLLFEDEVCYYKKPEELDAAILPAIPDHGFSMVVYLSTVSDGPGGLFFLDKLKIAMDNPDDWTIVFVPWFFTYPEKPIGIDFDSLILNDYENDVLVPAFKKEKLPREKWGDCIKWYRLRLQDQNNNHKKMKMEYPTTLEEVMLMGENKKVWEPELLDRQEENIRKGTPYRFITVNATGEVEAQKTDISPFQMFEQPVYGRKYRIVIDPITAHSGDTDYFAMHVMDMTNNYQVAVFRERGLSDEDYADWAVSMAKLYNRAELCPEINVANGFIVAVNALRYYHWYYENQTERKNRNPGLRTTVSTKERMIGNLTTLLERNNIKIRDRATLQELRDMEKIVKNRADGTRTVRMAARKGKHDDLCFAADTLIATDKGQIPIQNIRPGDMVWTSKGLRKVEATSRRKAEVITKFGITATPNHPFITANGIKEWQDLSIHDKIYLCPTQKELQSYIKEKNTTDTLNLREGHIGCITSAMKNGRNRQSFSIGESMKTILDQFLKGTKSTIKMVTQKIIPQKISLRCRPKNTHRTNLRNVGTIQSGEISNSIYIGVTHGENIFQNQDITKSPSPYTANSVATNSEQDASQEMLSFAQPVETCECTAEKKEKVGILAKRNRKKGLEKLSLRTKPMEEETEKRAVYNLQVSDVHEYYANGVLVHNCMALVLFAGSLDNRQLEGRKTSGGMVCW